MEVLTLESLDNLRKFVKESPDFRNLATRPLEDLEGELNLNFINLDLEALDRELPELHMKEVSPANLATTDVENAPVFFEGLAELSPAHATDERIWSTLALGHYASYTRYRYRQIPDDTKDDHKKARNWILAHWLCGAANRSKFRDNAISRLWWMGKICASIPGWSQQEVAKVMITNTDYRQQLLDRTTSFTATGVAKAVLEISREMEASQGGLSREGFRKVMMEISFVAGKSNLAVLSSRQLIELFKPIFEKQNANFKPKSAFKNIFSKKK